MLFYTSPDTRPADVSSEDWHLATCLDERFAEYTLRGVFSVEGPVVVNGKPAPLAANPKDNPHRDKRWMPGGYQIRVPLRRNVRHVLAHLRGECAIFEEARSSRRVVQLTLDFDGESWSNFESNQRWATKRFAEVFPNLTFFVEPSRSYPRTNGLHIRLFVRYAGGTDGPTRRRIETAMERALTTVFKDPPKGFKFDCIIGATSYTELNPHFDLGLARSIVEETGRMKPLIPVSDSELGLIYQLAPPTAVVLASEVDGKTWARQKLALDVTKSCPGPVPDFTDRQPTTMYSNINELEVYEETKSIYGLPGRHIAMLNPPFVYPLELEQKVVRHGQIGTAPCYEALSGNRPNNLLDYLMWSTDPDRILDQKDLVKVIGSDWENPEPAHKPLLDKRDETPGFSADEFRPKPSKDLDLLFSPEIEPIRRYAAGARIALRRCGGDCLAATSYTLTLWESPEGPSDGPRHPEREARARRIIDWTIRTFDLSKAGGGDAVWFSQDDVLQLQLAFQALFTEDDLEAARRRQGPSTRRGWKSQKIDHQMLAMAVAAFIKNTVTGNPGEVPNASIIKLLQHHNLRINGSTCSTIIQLLIDAGFIRRTKQAAPLVHRCSRYVLVGDIMRPAWAEPAINSEVWEPAAAELCEPASATAPVQVTTLPTLTFWPGPIAAGWRCTSPHIPPDKSIGCAAASSNQSRPSIECSEVSYNVSEQLKADAAFRVPRWSNETGLPPSKLTSARQPLNLFPEPSASSLFYRGYRPGPLLGSGRSYSGRTTDIKLLP